MTSFENPELNLSILIENMIRSRVLDIHTATPGIVAKYDSEKQTADIQLAIKRKIAKDGTTIPVPLLKSVPVIFPRTGKVSQHFPLEKGDGVLVIFCERSIDSWRNSDGASIVEPDTTPRFHDYNDAIALPGLLPTGKEMVFDSPEEGAGHVIASELMKISLTSDGKILLSRREQQPDEPVPLGLVLKQYLEDLHSEMEKILDVLIAGQSVMITSPGSPSAPNPAEVAKIVAAKTALNALKMSPISDDAFLSNILFTEKGD